jgi:hypothetical protein
LVILLLLFTHTAVAAAHYVINLRQMNKPFKIAKLLLTCSSPTQKGTMALTLPLQTSGELK